MKYPQDSHWLGLSSESDPFKGRMIPKNISDKPLHIIRRQNKVPFKSEAGENGETF